MPLVAAPQPLTSVAVATAAIGSVLFIENAGQWPDSARFQVRSGPETLWLAQDALWLTVITPNDAAASARVPTTPALDRPVPPAAGVNLRLSFAGANPAAPLEPANPLPTTISYFLGNNPDRWQPTVPVWGEVRYTGLVPGVDLVLSGAGGRWNWQLRGAPLQSGTVPVLRIEGANDMTQDGATLRLATAAGEVRLPLPAAAFTYQVERVQADGGVEVLTIPAGQMPDMPLSSQAPADHPADLLYSTFLGGSEDDNVDGDVIAVDAEDRACITGYTFSSDFPTTPGAFDPSFDGGSYDAFVARLNAGGSVMEYGTFLGSSGDDVGSGIAVDATNRVYITGSTGSSDFPTTAAAFDPIYNGYWDAFVVRLDAAGSAIEYGTFLGGSEVDAGDGITVEPTGRVYVAGWTWSSNFPTTVGALDPGYNGSVDAFVTRLNAVGNALEYGTFLGGSDADESFGIVSDTAGRAYVTGLTTSSDFPSTAAAFDPSYNGRVDAFVARLNAVGSALEYGTFLGGSDDDTGFGIALDAADRAFVIGGTQSSDFPTTAGAFDPSHNGGACGTPPYTYPCSDAFVVQMNAAGSALEYSTFLGSDESDYGQDIALDAAGRAYVLGATQSNDFPTTPGAFDPSHNGDVDAFVARLNSVGSALEYGTFLGGNNGDVGISIALDADSRAYVAGYTLSNDFPTTAGAFDPSFNGSSDAFVSKLSLALTPTSVGLGSLGRGAPAPLNTGLFLALAMATLAGAAVLLRCRR